jgi:hypothetical protein
VGEGGGVEYLSLSGKALGERDGYVPFYDIEVDATKKTPTEVQKKNEFAKELFDAGAFKPENVKQTLMMLELMDFEGVGKLKADLRQAYSCDCHDQS